MKFKKSIAMAMSVLMAAGMLAGCGSNGSTSSSTASGSASSASGEYQQTELRFLSLTKTPEAIPLMIQLQKQLRKKQVSKFR